MHQIFIICIVLLVTSTLTDKPDDKYTYDNFMKQYQRNYKDSQKVEHQQIFNKNYAELKKLNENGASLIINQYLDWNDTEKAQFLTFPPDKNPPPISSLPINPNQLFLSPTTFDWRSYDRLTPVKAQGRCGACWAFASTAQYQSLIVIATNGTKYDLSQQYLLQCDTQADGCYGGWPWSALQLANKTGIPLETQYPYQASSNYYNISTICKDNNTKKTGFNASLVNINYPTVQQLQQYLVSYGPISVGIGAGNCPSFMQAGPTTNISCYPNTSIDHAVLLVGYDQTRWIIKNSWNTRWGNEGYGYVNKANNTGLSKYIFMMQLRMPWNPVPFPPADSITLTIWMNDTYGDGWNGNVLGFRQNGSIIATFGASFNTGKIFGPVNVTIPGNIQTRIVVSTYGKRAQEISFTIKAQNGTTIFTRLNGVRFSSQAVFFDFCPARCSAINTITYYLTMADVLGKGCGGSFLAFRQNGVFQTFELPPGKLFTGPLAFSFTLNVNIDIVVYTFGNYSKSCGLNITSGSNRLVFQKIVNTIFYADTLLGNFIPSSIALTPSGIQIESSNRKEIQQDQNTSSSDSQQSLKIATFVLATLFLITIIALIPSLIYYIKNSKLLKEKTKQIPIKQQSQNKSYKNVQI